MLPHNIKRFPIRGNAGADTACEATAQLTPHGAALVSDKNSPVGVTGDGGLITVTIGDGLIACGNYFAPERFIPGNGGDLGSNEVAIKGNIHCFISASTEAGHIHGAPGQKQEQNCKISHNEPPEKKYQCSKAR